MGPQLDLMKYDVDIVDDFLEKHVVANVPDNNVHAPGLHRSVEIFEPTGRHVVYDDNLVASHRGKLVDDMRADKTGTAGYKYSFALENAAKLRRGRTPHNGAIAGIIQSGSHEPAIHSGNTRLNYTSSLSRAIVSKGRKAPMILASAAVQRLSTGRCETGLTNQPQPRLSKLPDHSSVCWLLNHPNSEDSARARRATASRSAKAEGKTYPGRGSSNTPFDYVHEFAARA
jgi:hypothetical protein